MCNSKTENHSMMTEVRAVVYLGAAITGKEGAPPLDAGHSCSLYSPGCSFMGVFTLQKFTTDSLSYIFIIWTLFLHVKLYFNLKVYFNRIHYRKIESYL